MECRQCRTTLFAIARAEFERDYGNAIPYGQRFGLLVFGLLIAATALVIVLVGRGAVVTAALAAVWAVVGIVLSRTGWVSTFTRKRRR